MSERIIRAIQLGPEGIDITYMSDGDVRAEGAIYQTHSISISRNTDDLEDLIGDLEEAANDLLQAAIQTWAGTLPFDVLQALRADDDEDDDD